MRVETARFGALEVDPKTSFHFPMGLLGFTHLTDYVVIDHGDTPFKWLQSIQDGALAFITTDPTYFKPDYQLELKRREIQIIASETQEDLIIEDLIVSVILTIPGDPKRMTANLLAPLIFNLATRRAMQLVLTSPRYPVRYPVFGAGQTLKPSARSQPLTLR
ncbi:flagellar assembly protein FliW [Myxococcota bacterium]|nr:flagellar assembly protein FliW [Myxococcota bacterium]MBU1429384.1 flagellar assembly protein FliW [Myxococcota bacterium]MBU1899241.1 flagellar assembly protein FliW [Myxococcota bacterium]